MKRWFVCSLLATALLAARGVAQEPAQLGGADYYADSSTPTDGNCPDGTAGGYGGYGHHAHTVEVTGSSPVPPILLLALVCVAECAVFQNSNARTRGAPSGDYPN